jgi:dTDP-glucose 4,6-dehydratase
MPSSKRLLVTGGAGFIGSNFVLEAVRRGHEVVNLDALTYAGNLDNLASLDGQAKHTFVHGSILDAELVEKLLSQHRPDAVVHFAAESHVDRSILGPGAFIETNVNGTFTLLQAALKHWRGLTGEIARWISLSTRVDGRGVWIACARRGCVP